HTPGQLVVKVKTSAGTVLLASDAVHYLEELERDMPFTLVADLPAMLDGLSRIRALTSSGEVSAVVPGHDPDVLARFEPLAGDTAVSGFAVAIGTFNSSKVA